MSIGRMTCCTVVVCAALARPMLAQDTTVTFEQKTPLLVSGFAVGTANYDRNRAQNGALASKVGLSLFRPWSDQLYFFGQLTTHVDQAGGGPPATAIDIDNLIINWTPARLSTLSLSFGRFDAPIGFGRDDQPLNLMRTTCFTFGTARPAEFTGLTARYSPTRTASVHALGANRCDRAADN